MAAAVYAGRLRELIEAMCTKHACMEDEVITTIFPVVADSVMEDKQDKIEALVIRVHKLEKKVAHGVGALTLSSRDSYSASTALSRARAVRRRCDAGRSVAYLHVEELD